MEEMVPPWGSTWRLTLLETRVSQNKRSGTAGNAQADEQFVVLADRIQPATENLQQR